MEYKFHSLSTGFPQLILLQLFLNRIILLLLFLKPQYLGVQKISAYNAKNIENTMGYGSLWGALAEQAQKAFEV